MDILRGNTVIATVHPTDDSVYSCKLMGDNIVKLNFRLAVAVSLAFGDHIIWGGQTFTLNTEHTAKEIATREIEYNCEFQGVDYELLKAGYKLFDNTPVPPQGDFSLTGNALTFIQLLVANMNRNGSGWTVGEVIESDFKTLDFSGDKCLAALQRLATEFETEFYIAGKVVNLRKKPFAGSIINLSYGMGDSLKWLQRINRDEDPIITCLFAYGSDKNLPIGYRDGATRLMLPGEGYLLENVTLYGVREGDKIFENIYPRLLAGGSTDPGKVTAVNGNLKFADTNLDFDVHEYLGVNTAKVVFNSGELAGYEFEISAFDNATQTYTIIAQEYDGMMLPNDVFFPSVGDRYVLVDMQMPEAYVVRAELELATAALAYIDEYSRARDAFKGGCDTLHFKNNNIALSIAQVVRIQSTSLNVDREIRIIGYTQNINEPYQYDVEFGEKPVAGKIEKLTNTVNNNANAISSTQKLNWTTTLQLMELIKGAKTATDFSELTGLPSSNSALKEYLDRIGDSAFVDTETKLISGAIIWKSGLTYTSTDIVYKILGVSYTAQAKEITLTPSDPNLSRIDTFYVDVFGNLQAATGTPAINALNPVLNATQLEVSNVFLLPGATEPSNVDIVKVYDENTGWGTSETHDPFVSVDFNNSLLPKSGSKRIKVNVAIPDTEISSPLHYIGEKYQGGRIFYIDASGKKGLIASEADTALDVFWSSLSGYSAYTTGATGQVVGTGQANTALMLANNAAKNLAVKFCNDFAIEGYIDWFMPSIKELLAMYFRRQEIGNFANKTYWSSSENAWNSAWCIAFGNGVEYSRVKNNNYCVRAIRAFDDTTLPAGTAIKSFVPVTTKLTFTSPEPVNSLDGILSLNIKSSIPWLANSILLIESFLAGNKTGSVAISPATNLFGYKPDSDVWQLIAIQMYNFASGQPTLDTFKISIVGSWPNNIDLGLDDIRYQYSATEAPIDVLTNPGTFGSATKHVVLTVNSQGKITEVEEVTQEGIVIAANLDLNSHKIVNLAQGTESTDAVNKGQVETIIANATSGIGSSIHVPVSDLLNAKAVDLSQRLDMMLMLIESMGLYRFDGDIVADSNDMTVILPDDVSSDALPGRWIKISTAITDHNLLSGILGNGGYHLSLAEREKLLGIKGLADLTSADGSVVIRGSDLSVKLTDPIKNITRSISFNDTAATVFRDFYLSEFKIAAIDLRGISLVEYSTTGATFVPVALPLTIPANSDIYWRVTFTGGASSGFLNIIGSDININLITAVMRCISFNDLTSPVCRDYYKRACTLSLMDKRSITVAEYSLDGITFLPANLPLAIAANSDIYWRATFANGATSGFLNITGILN